MTRATLLVPILALALTLPVFAQAEREVKTGGKSKEETLKLMINGGVNIAWYYESEQLREAFRWENGGTTLRPDTSTFYGFNGPAWVSFWATLQDNVEMNITLRTVPFENNNSFQANGVANGITDRRNWGDDVANGEIAVKYAWMKIKEVFDPAWSFSVGQMDIIWDVRGRGNCQFLDVAHSESPWADVNRAWATTVRQEESPVGFKIDYTRDNFQFELGLFPVIHDAQTRFGISDNSDQEAIYYLSGVFNLGNYGGKLGAIVALFHGVNPSDNVVTVGASVLFVPAKDFEVFAEGYGQFGQSWSQGRAPLGGAPAGFLEDGDHSAFMGMIGARMDVPGDTAAFIELHFIYMTGQDMEDGTQFSNATGFALGGLTNDESNEWMSYENYDVMLLLNSNEWGFDFDNNMLQITLQGGVLLSTGGSMKNNLHLLLAIAYAAAPNTWDTAAVAGVHPAADDDIYGFEVDFTIRWYMNKNANLYYSIAYLAGSTILENFTRDEDGFAWLMLIGAQVAH